MPNVLIDIRPTQNVHRKSGIGRYAKNLISRLPLLDPENSYHFLHYDGAGLPELPDVVGQKVTFLPFPKSKPRIGDGKIWGRVAREHRIDLIHILDIETPYPLPPGVKLLCTVHDLIPAIHPDFSYYKMDMPRRWKNRIRYAFYMNNLHKVDGIIAVSENTKKDVVRIGGVGPEKISVVYEGVNFDDLQEAGGETGVLQKYGIREPYILHLGGLDRRKNILRLLESYREANIPDHQLVIAGKSREDMKAIEDGIARLRLEKQVHLPGFIDDADLKPIYNNAAFFVYLSLYEGFGLPVLEAMAAGTPVITSNVSSIPEIAGDAACLVNPEDTAEIASALRRLAEGGADREELVTRGRQRASHFSWGRTAAETISVYRKAIQGAIAP